MNKNTLLLFSGLLIAFVVVSLALTGCSTPLQENDSDVIKIGVIAPLSGDLAPYGIALVNGITMAIENKNSSNRFSLIVEDSEYNPTKAISAYNSLELKGADIIFNWGNPTGQVISQITTVPFITVSTDEEITKNNSLIIRAYNRPEDQSKVIWTVLRENNFSDIGLFKLENLYENSLVDGLEEHRKEDETIHHIDNFQWSSNDFRSSLLKARQLDLDALAVFLCAGQINNFYKQLYELDDSYITFGTDCFEDLAILEASKKEMDGVMFVSIGVEKEFENRYISRFDSKSAIFVAGTSYDILSILSNYNSTSLNSPSKIMNILNVQHYDGVMGTYDLEETETDRYFSYPTRLRKLIDGEVITLETYYE